jgi:hypothetical protein
MRDNGRSSERGSCKALVFRITHADGSSSSCIFRKVDNCLLDPNLFQRVDEVTASGLGLIDYEPETFPLIEARDWDFYINAGDLPGFGNSAQNPVRLH